MRINFNILKSLKMLLSAVVVVLTLAGCSNDTEQAPMGSEQDPVAIAENHAECWQSGVIDLLYDLTGTAAISAYRKLTDGALPLMMVIFALWLSYRLIRHVSSWTEENMGEVWTEIAKKFFLCFVCGLIASRFDLLTLVLGDVIFPIFNAFLELASEFLQLEHPIERNVVHNMIDAGIDRDLLINGTLETGIPMNAQTMNAVSIHDNDSIVDFTIFGYNFGFNPVMTCYAGDLGHITSESTGFPKGPQVMMDCMVCSMNSALGFGQKLAFAVMASASFMRWIVGLLVLICFWFVKLGFVFYLIDAIFRFTVMVMMLPVMIMGYPFPQTKNLLSRGVANMLSSASFMLFFAIIITVCIKAISLVLKNLEDNKIWADQAAFDDFSVPFVCIAMICFVLISSIKIAGKLSNTFVGGGFSSQFQKTAKALIMGSIKMIASFGGRALLSLLPESIRFKAIEKFEGGMRLIDKAKGAGKKATGG